MSIKKKVSLANSGYTLNHKHPMAFENGIYKILNN